MQYFFLFLSKFFVMRNTDTFRQYIWLVNTLQRSRKITFEHIQSLWVENDMNDGKPLSRTTFYRLRQAIEDMFGIIIECDSYHQYFISNPETLRDKSTQNWMLQTLSVNNILIDSISIKDRLLLEEIPAGLEFLPIIIQAIKDNHELTMTYHKFDEPQSYTIPIQPYCLKVFRQRWYLLGKKNLTDSRLQIYALDRIQGMEETSIHFDMDPDFDAEVFFKKHFGIFIGEKGEVQRIVLRAYKKMVSLLRTLPLHSSQKEIVTSENYSDFEYYLIPSFDFKQAILKEGAELEVIEPIPLRNMISEELSKTLNLYLK